MTIAKTIPRIFDATLSIGAALSGALLIVVMLLTVIKVFFRYVLGQGLIGVDQISGTLLLYIAFLGAAWVLRKEEHVRVDLLLSYLNLRVRRCLDVTTSVIGALVCLVLTIYGATETASSLQRGILIPAEIEIPRAVNLAVIPLGSLLLCLQFVRRARRFLDRDEVPVSESGGGV